MDSASQPRTAFLDLLKATQSDPKPAQPETLSNAEIVALALAPFQREAKQQHEEIMKGIARLEAKVDALALITHAAPSPTTSRTTQMPASSTTSTFGVPAPALTPLFGTSSSFSASSSFSPSFGQSPPPLFRAAPASRAQVGYRFGHSPYSFGHQGTFAPFGAPQNLASAQKAAEPVGFRFSDEQADVSAYLHSVANHLVDTVRQDPTLAAIVPAKQPEFDFIYGLRSSTRPLDRFERSLVAAYHALPRWELAQIAAVVGNDAEDFELVGFPDLEPSSEQPEGEVVPTGERDGTSPGAWGALCGDDEEMPALEVVPWSDDSSIEYWDSNSDSDSSSPSPLAGSTSKSASDSEDMPALVEVDVFAVNRTHTGFIYLAPFVNASVVEVRMTLEEERAALAEERERAYAALSPFDQVE